MRLPTSTAIGWALCLQIAQCAPASNATSMQSSMGTIPTSMYNGTLSVNGTTPAVRLSNGSYFGYHLPSFNQEVFLGMTFAQPPTNSLRFAPPASLNSTWSGMRNATSYGFSCHSFGVDGDNNGQIESEDCLTINVVRPSGFTNQSLPVAVWIYGGGFNEGVTARDIYNLSYPVQQSVFGNTPVIGVSVNYRLGGYGFLSSFEVANVNNLNNGILDQRLALHWVQENIGAFGGDPTKVTIWGESAGAESVAMHLLAYGGRDDGLFHQGIMESGSMTTPNFFPVGYYQPSYDNLTAYVGCNESVDSLECLRTNATVDQLNFAFNHTNGIATRVFNLVIDGSFIPAWPKTMLANKQFVKVPILSGANLDEGTAFGPGNVNTTQDIKNWLYNTYPYLTNNTVNELLQLYPNNATEGAPFGTGNQFENSTLGLQYKRGSAIGGDIVMIAPRRLICETYSAMGLPVYGYVWNQSDFTTPASAGASHFQEVVYVFDNPGNLTQSASAPIGPDPTGAKKRLADMTSRRWMSFVGKGDPNQAVMNSSNTTVWPSYTQNKQVFYLSPGASFPMDDTFREDGIHFLNYGIGHQLLN